MDLAGHHKYMRTTVFGLTSHCPDYAMLVVSANRGIGGQITNYKIVFLYKIMYILNLCFLSDRICMFSIF